MRTTMGRTRLATPYLAVPPPAGRAMRRLYLRHATTLGAIATVALAVAALDWLLIPRGPDVLPLWLVLAAGFGSVAVGASVRRMERRRGAPHAAQHPAPPDRAAAADRHGGWRDGIGIAVAAASVALLLLALVVPHGARSIVLAAGLTGVLTLRLVLPPHRAAVAVVPVARAPIAGPAPEDLVDGASAPDRSAPSDSGGAR